MDEKEQFEKIVNENYNLRNQLEEQKKKTGLAKDECYRLKSELKKYKEGIRTEEAYKVLKAQIESEKEKSNNLRSEICRLKQNRPTDKQQEINKRLKEENKALKFYQKQYRTMSVNILKLQKENEATKEALKMLVTKNKRVFGSYYQKAVELEDKARISFATVLLDFEFMFTFQKLFEMHVFDYIVDRQNPDNKTDLQTKELYIDCKNYTTNLIKSMCYRIGFDAQELKHSFKIFTDDYVEKGYEIDNERYEDIREESDALETSLDIHEEPKAVLSSCPVQETNSTELNEVSSGDEDTEETQKANGEDEEPACRRVSS